MPRRKHPLVWFELPVDDFARATAFYRKLFGWAAEQSRPDPDEYWHLDAGEQSIDGGLTRRTVRTRPEGGPLFYVQVEDLEEAVLRARRLGATLEREPVFLGRDSGVIAAIRDLDENVIGLWAPE